MGIFDRVTTEEEQLDPWAPTLNPLTQHANMLNNQDPWTSYQGDWVSDMNRTQTGALGNITNYGNREAQWFGNRMQNTGRQMMDNGQNAQNYFNNALNWSAIQNNGPDMEMVAKLADNPYMNGMIDSVGRDISRNLYEDQMPGIAAASAGAGQTGSSRRGAAEAIASRGAADRLADTSATLRGNAYNTALGLGTDISTQNARLQFDNRGQGLDAANQIRGMAQEGVGMIESGGDMRRQGYGDALMAGDRLQAQDQAEVDALMAQHMLDQELPYNQAQAGFNALMDPASQFGERNNTRTKEWDGAPDVITALLTGGGTTINNNNNNNNANNNENSGNGDGGGSPNWLERVFGNVFGGNGDWETPPTFPTNNGNGGGGTPPYVPSGTDTSGRTGTSGNNNNGNGGTPPFFPNGTSNTNAGNTNAGGMMPDPNNPGGPPVAEGNSNAGGDNTSQAIADLIAQGMTMAQALESLGLSGPDTGDTVDTEIEGGTSTRLPEGATSTEPVTGVPDDPSLSDLEAALANSGMTPEQIRMIMDINNGSSAPSPGGQQGGGQVNPSLVSPGFAGGNIVDGTYYDPTQDIQDMLMGGNTPDFGPSSGPSFIPTLDTVGRMVNDFINAYPDAQIIGADGKVNRNDLRRMLKMDPNMPSDPNSKEFNDILDQTAAVIEQTAAESLAQGGQLNPDGTRSTVSEVEANQAAAKYTNEDGSLNQEAVDKALKQAMGTDDFTPEQAIQWAQNIAGLLYAATGGQGASDDIMRYVNGGFGGGSLYSPGFSGKVTVEEY